MSAFPPSCSSHHTIFTKGAYIISSIIYRFTTRPSLPPSTFPLAVPRFRPLQTSGAYTPPGLDFFAEEARVGPQPRYLNLFWYFRRTQLFCSLGRSRLVSPSAEYICSFWGPPLCVCMHTAAVVVSFGGLILLNPKKKRCFRGEEKL